MTFSRSGYDTQIKLSPEELFEISQEISRKFAPNAASLSSDSAFLSGAFPSRYSLRKSAKSQVNSIFHSSQHSHTRLSPQEMFEISQEISRKFSPDASTGTPELVLLPVDPYHLYAYWNLGENKKLTESKDEPANPLILRIYWRPDESADISNTKIWFDIAFNTFQSRQKVRLPIDGTAYSAVIGKLHPDNGLTVFADSNIIHVPCDKMKPSPMQRPSIKRKEPLPAVGPIAKPVLQAPEKSINAAETLHHEQALPDAGTFGIRYEKDLNKRTVQEKNRDNEILFFSKMKNMLCEKDINEHYIPKTSASETFYYKNEMPPVREDK